MQRFEVSRQRLERAYAHAAQFAQEWNALDKENLYTFRANVNRDGTGSIRMIRVKPIPPLFSLLLGEFLYQLRAALDACIYRAAVLNNGGQDPPPTQTNSSSSFAGMRTSLPTSLTVGSNHSQINCDGSWASYSLTALTPSR